MRIRLLPSRIWYLFSRIALRPHRGFGVIRDFNPALDIIILVIVGSAWFGLIAALSKTFPLLAGRVTIHETVALALDASAAYLFFSGLALLHGLLVSLVVLVTGGRARPFRTAFAFALAAAVALALAGPLIAILWAVEIRTLNPVSASMIRHLPYLYILFLEFLAVEDLHRVPNPVAALYLAIGLVPIGAALWFLPLPVSSVFLCL